MTYDKWTAQDWEYRGETGQEPEDLDPGCEPWVEAETAAYPQ